MTSVNVRTLYSSLPLSNQNLQHLHVIFIFILCSSLLFCITYHDYSVGFHGVFGQYLFYTYAEFLNAIMIQSAARVYGSDIIDDNSQ